MRGTGADRPVVVENPGNAGGAKGPGHPGVDGGQPLRREEPVVASEAKPFVIPKQAVWKAWLRVKANAGAAGIDEQSIAALEADLKDNLYKLWNRMSSGSYFPPPVRAVPIPKRDGAGERILGVPTVADRIAQLSWLTISGSGWNRCSTRTATDTGRGGGRWTRSGCAGSVAGDTTG